MEISKDEEERRKKKRVGYVELRGGKSKNRMKILTALYKEELSFSALQQKTDLTKPTLLSHLKTMGDETVRERLGTPKRMKVGDGTVAYRPLNPGRSLAVYQITDKGRDEVKTVGESVRTILDVPGIRKTLELFAPREAIAKFTTLAEEDPALLLDLFQTAEEFLAFSSSPVGSRWIEKHGQTELGSVTRQEIEAQLKGKDVKTEEQALDTVKQALARTKERIAQDKGQ